MSAISIQERANTIYEQEERNFAMAKIDYSVLRTAVDSALKSLCFNKFKHLRQLIIDYSLNLHQAKQILTSMQGDKSETIKSCVDRINFIFREIYQSDGTTIEILVCKSDKTTYSICINKTDTLKNYFIAGLTFDGVTQAIEENILAGICCRAFQKNLPEYAYELLSFFDSGKPNSYLNSVSCLSVVLKLPRLFALSLADRKKYCSWEVYTYPKLTNGGNWNEKETFALYLNNRFQDQELGEDDDFLHFIYTLKISSLNDNFLKHLIDPDITENEPEDLFKLVLDCHLKKRNRIEKIDTLSRFFSSFLNSQTMLPGASILSFIKDFNK